MRGPRIIVVFIILLTVSLAGTGVAQDFGQLLQAIDKLESNLKGLIKKEQAVRSAEIDKLRVEWKNLGQNASSPYDGTELETLRAEVLKLSRAFSEISKPVNDADDSDQLAAIRSDLEWLKMELQSLKLFADASSARFTSLESPAWRAASPAPAQQAGPKYHNLRFNDNYSYLSDNANRGHDLFDPLKRISLGGKTELSFGGQYRFRYESDNNRKLGGSDPESQEVYLNRLFLFGDFKVANLFRFFAEFKYAGISNNELPAGAITHDKPDLENLFADGWVFNSKGTRLGLRVGRQELQYGKQRLISPLDWANTRRTFDGVRVMSAFKGWSLDGFVTRPVGVNPNKLNKPASAQLFAGLYSSKKLNKHLFSGYFLIYSKNAPVSPATGLSTSFDYLTLGTGYDGKGGSFDWSTEAAYQFGKQSGNSISAYMLSINGGYSFKDHPAKPRIGVGWDMASGDNDPSDSKVNTFHQLFPLGHAFLGWADQVGRRNINAFTVQLSAKPSKNVVAKLNWFSFGLMEEKDALYNAGGKVSRQDITGASGRSVGNELDALVILKLNRHASLHMGYLHFKPGKFIRNTGSSESHNMVYLMLPVKF